MTRFSPLAVAAALLLAAGCGDGGTVNPSEQVDTPGRTPPPVTETSGDDGTEDGVVVVVARNIDFDPRQVVVDAGTTIRWVNEDAVPHNVVAEEGADFRSEQFGKGESFEATVEEPGTIKYVCTIHPGQDGTIVVRDTGG